MNFAIWQHLFNISVLRFRDSFGSASIVCIFSVRLTSQYFEPAKYVVAFATIFHENSQFFPASFSAHTYVENVVLFAFLFLRLCLWLLYRPLNVPPVDPIYFFVLVYTPHFCTHYTLPLKAILLILSWLKSTKQLCPGFDEIGCKDT